MYGVLQVKPQVTNIKQSLIRSQANLGPVLVDFRGAPRAASATIGHLAIFSCLSRAAVQPCGLRLAAMHPASRDATSRFGAF